MESSAVDADGLSRLCGDLPELREQARLDGWSAELGLMLTGLRAGTLPVPTALERVCDRLGLPVRPRGYAPVPGQDPAPPPAGAYTCPGGRCSRVERREPGGPLPECAVFDAPLTFG
ncbi:hypothetical protein [Streptomyces lavendofoliae]|uniref:hypothetical protein n=1 Tax=Streptomyces lavendofoliae TaxID=67314 RepID=UPI0016741689|nr:hypothetical protein [Streptomyces lavendofoliae]